MKSNSPVINIHENPFKTVSEAAVRGAANQAVEVGKEINREIFGTEFSKKHVDQANNEEIINSQRIQMISGELASIKNKSMVDLTNPAQADMKGNAKKPEEKPIIDPTLAQPNKKVAIEHHEAAKELGVQNQNRKAQEDQEKKDEDEQEKLAKEQAQKESMETPVEAPGKQTGVMLGRKPQTRASRMLRKPPSAETRGTTNRE